MISTHQTLTFRQTDLRSKSNAVVFGGSESFVPSVLYSFGQKGGHTQQRVWLEVGDPTAVQDQVLMAFQKKSPLWMFFISKCI